ncbi:hypothetical protein HPB52_005487 [Rhipicephalus sanguineus]|uniref:Uncharacterized protein n=1 Tax=Rhipicephalus sanguineus TaxID=34632 RepID=A0A9D4PUL4_RHISA|nr:hypothetical protein HPB52_005487 [Rhipicephalus sanguineus]
MPYEKGGGGQASESALKDELQRVVAVASHMSIRLDNPFDRDRVRHKATDDDSCTPTVAAVLAPMQAVPVAELTEVSPFKMQQEAHFKTL